MMINKNIYVNKQQLSLKRVALNSLASKRLVTLKMDFHCRVNFTCVQT